MATSLPEVFGTSMRRRCPAGLRGRTLTMTRTTSPGLALARSVALGSFAPASPAVTRTSARGVPEPPDVPSFTSLGAFTALDASKASSKSAGSPMGTRSLIASSDGGAARSTGQNVRPGARQMYWKLATWRAASGSSMLLDSG